MPGSLSLTLPLQPLPSFFFSNLPGRDNCMPTESRDWAEGIFKKRALAAKTFHLALYLAKTGCRVPWLSEGTHQRGDETRGDEGMWNVMSVKEKRGKLTSLELLIYWCFGQAPKRGRKWRRVRHGHERKRKEKKSKVEQNGDTQKPAALMRP